MKRSTPEPLSRNPPGKGGEKDASGTPKSKSVTSSRNSSLSSAASPWASQVSPSQSSGCVRKTASRKCPVRLVYSIINDSSHVETEEISSSVLFFNSSASADEREPTALRLHADHVFCADSDPAQTMTRQLVETNALGESAVVAMISDCPQERCNTFFGSENSLVAAYCHAMITELENNSLCQLCAVRYCVVRIEGDEMFQVTSHAGGSNSFRVASLTEAEENSTSFARHRDDVVDLLREISKATAHDSDHVIVMLRVAPIAPVKSSGTQILKGIAQLMKPLGCLCLALLGSADAAKCTKKELAAVRHSTRVLGSVLAAILRQWNRNSSSEDGGPSTGGNRHLSSVPLYVPFRDDGLTQALEPLLADGPAIAFLWLHLDGAALRPSSSELLQAADVVSNARFPNGRPPINFALLARQEHAVVVRLRQELATCRQAWDTERALLESDRLMLRKAYEAASHSTASSPPAQISAVFGNADEQQPTKSLRDTLQMTKLMLATAQREKVELERELTELRAQQAAPQRPNAMPSAEVSFVVSAAEVLVKEGIVERGTGETAHTALLQLVQQLAEREKVLFHMHPENDLSRKLLPPARWAEVLSRLKSSDGVSRMVGPSLGSDSPAAKGRKRSNTLL